MPTHMTATRDKWPEARLDLLAAEKDLTRRSDDVARLRQQLPWVRGDKNYTFDTEEGHKVLKDLFGGRSSSSSTTSCSGLSTSPGVLPARRSPTDSTAARYIWKTTMSHFSWCRVRRSRTASVQATDGLDVSLGIIGPRGV